MLIISYICRQTPVVGFRRYKRRANQLDTCLTHPLLKHDNETSFNDSGTYYIYSQTNTSLQFHAKLSWEQTVDYRPSFGGQSSQHVRRRHWHQAVLSASLPSVRSGRKQCFLDFQRVTSAVVHTECLNLTEHPDSDRRRGWLMKT